MFSSLKIHIEPNSSWLKQQIVSLIFYIFYIVIITRHLLWQHLYQNYMQLCADCTHLKQHVTGSRLNWYRTMPGPGSKLFDSTITKPFYEPRLQMWKPTLCIHSTSNKVQVTQMHRTPPLECLIRVSNSSYACNFTQFLTDIQIPPKHKITYPPLYQNF